MNEHLYELSVEKNHLNIIIKALSNYICFQYDGLDAEVVDVPKTMENIKIASDMQLVLKHHLGGVQHSPKQTAETTGLVWIRDVLAQEPFEPFSDENLQDVVVGSESTGQSCFRTRKQMKEYATKCANRNIQLF